MHEKRYMFYLKKIIACSAVVLIMMTLVSGKACYDAMRCYHEAVVCVEAEKYVKAITYFDRALHWYMPFNAYIKRSAERLWQMSKDAESRGDLKLALIAAKTIRRGFYSARSFYTPGKEWIEKCDKRIEKLWAIQKDRKGVEANERDGRPVKAGLQYQESKAPDSFWSSMLLLGLFGWIGSMSVFILRGFRKGYDDSFVLKPHLKWVGLSAVFYLIWILGMMRA